MNSSLKSCISEQEWSLSFILLHVTSSTCF